MRRPSQGAHDLCGLSAHLFQFHAKNGGVARGQDSPLGTWFLRGLSCSHSPSGPPGSDRPLSPPHSAALCRPEAGPAPGGGAGRLLWAAVVMV